MTEDEPPVPFADENDLEDIIAEIPALIEIRDFAIRVGAIAWFHDVGDRLDAAQRDLAQAYLDGLGFPDVSVAQIMTWEDAADAAVNLDIHTPAWDAEEQLRAALTANALELIEEEALTVALNHVAAKAGTTLQNVTPDLRALWDVDDEGLMTAAAGAAVQVSHQAALTIAAGADSDHPFMLKFKLFESGRWPIGIVGSSFNLF